MIIYAEIPKRNHTKATWITDFSKVAGYKTNTQKSIAFPYSSDKQLEIKIKTTIPFTIVPKSITYLGINLTKYVQDLHAENSNERNQRSKRMAIPCSWISRLINIINMSVFSKLIYKFNPKQNHSILFFLTSLLEYNCFTMVC